MRVVADNEEELALFMSGIKEFTTFNLYLEDGTNPKQELEGKKKEEEKEKKTEEYEEPKSKKIKKLENRLLQPSSSSSSLFSTIYDVDADDFGSQKYTII